MPGESLVVEVVDQLELKIVVDCCQGQVYTQCRNVFYRIRQIVLYLQVGPTVNDTKYESGGSE